MMQYKLRYDGVFVQSGYSVRFENGFFRTLAGRLRLTPGAPTEPKVTASEALDQLIQAFDRIRLKRDA
jgi:hypothetical protein